YGTIVSSGCRVHALMPASASEAPINFRNPRRPTGSSHSEAFCGNSRCRNSLNSVVSATASRLRQYSRPRVPCSLARSAWMSVLMSGSSMTRRAVGAGPDLVRGHEPGTQRRLILRWSISHREDLFARANVVLGIAVTVDTPFHLERVLLPHERHLIDAPMAGLAAHPLLHVDAVIEVHEVRQVVDADPLHRLVFAEAGAHRLEDRRRLPDLRVAVHARLRGRDPGEGRGLNRCVAIPAVNPIVEHVMEMAELHRLLDVLLRTGHVRGAAKEHREPDQPSDQQEDARETDLGKGVGASMENLGHRRLGSGAGGILKEPPFRLVPRCEKRIKQPDSGVVPCATARFYAQTR